MDRHQLRRRFSFLLAGSLIGLTGCALDPTPTPTIWDKLGVTGASARLRDGLVNRNGNFPGLEKKPPLLRIADPANLDPDKPEVIQAAAKIKQDQDLKKQKLKAIKFLAETGCGCQNKDDKVTKALLQSLDDCDPDIRRAVIEAICQNAGGAACSCNGGCTPNCCSEEIVEKLKEMAFKVDADGCPKEPDPSIRKLAAAAVNKCPTPRKKIEEIPLPDEIEEIPAIEFESSGGERPLPEFEGSSGERPLGFKQARDSVRHVSYAERASMPKVVADDDLPPVHAALRKGVGGEPIGAIVNSSLLIDAKLVQSIPTRNTMVLGFRDTYQLNRGNVIVVVDDSGNQQVGNIEASDGRVIHVRFDTEPYLNPTGNGGLRVGLIRL